MGQFNPEFYQQFRPYYPSVLFEDLSLRVKQRKIPPPFRVVDIGCGTGHSTISALASDLPLQILGMDPDLSMLEKANANKKNTSLPPHQSLEFIQGRGESTGLPCQSVDLILVGSAFHWMDPNEASQEFCRILAPSGWIRIFEYQFPRATQLPELNNWIRRQFNLHWKAPGQTPRGSLREITQIFRKNSRFEALSEGCPPMKLFLMSDDLSGLIFSQSRVLHYESTLGATEIEPFRNHVKAHVKKLMMNTPQEFDFKLAYFDFGLKP